MEPEYNILYLGYSLICIALRRVKQAALSRRLRVLSFFMDHFCWNELGLHDMAWHASEPQQPNNNMGSRGYRVSSRRIFSIWISIL
jgi:hypothetical protein